MLRRWQLRPAAPYNDGIMIGSRFGQFEITAKLGEGGMGVVYEAFDSDLGRKVAVKVLPAKTAGDPNHLERFRRD